MLSSSPKNVLVSADLASPLKCKKKKKKKDRQNLSHQNLRHKFTKNMFKKNVASKLYHMENLKNSRQTVRIQMRWLMMSQLIRICFANSITVSFLMLSVQILDRLKTSFKY